MAKYETPKTLADVAPSLAVLGADMNASAARGGVADAQPFKGAYAELQKVMRALPGLIAEGEAAAVKADRAEQRKKAKAKKV